MTPRRRRGTTLVEIIVYTGLFGLVMTGISSTFILGNRWYMQNSAIIRAEQAASTGARRLARELVESNLQGVSFFPNSTNPNSIPGVIFISPHDPAANEMFGYNMDSGNTRWYKYVCYYADTDPTDATRLAIFRKQWAPWSNSSSNIDTLPGICAHDTNWFRNLNAPALVVAHDIANAAEAGWPGRGGFEVFSGTNISRNYDAASNPIMIRVVSNAPWGTATNMLNTSLQVSVRN